jgi:hypothetical protein
MPANQTVPTKRSRVYTSRPLALLTREANAGQLDAVQEEALAMDLTSEQLVRQNCGADISAPFKAAALAIMSVAVEDMRRLARGWKRPVHKYQLSPANQREEDRLAETLTWIFAPEPRGFKLFDAAYSVTTFDGICETLRADPESLRKVLRAGYDKTAAAHAAGDVA